MRLRSAGIGLHSPLAPRERPLATFLVVESQTLWVNFARSYYLSCALGTKSPDGGKLALGVPRFATEQAALQFAVKVKGVASARGEPIWHDLTAFDRSMTALNLGDRTRLTRALGYPSAVFADLNPCRNFFAHRSRSAAQKVKTVARRNGIPPDLPASDVVCSPASGHSQSLLVDWLDDLTAIIEILAVP